MKGTSFQKPLELSLQVEGEAWKQGDRITGALVAKNHGGESVPLREIYVRLAHGSLKQVRQKSADAFEQISAVAGDASGMLAAGAEARISWSFQTDRNCPITDSSSSVFLLYGRGEALESLGQLQLTVHPDEVIQEFLKVLTIQFHFVVKTRKASKRGVDVKLAPPPEEKSSILLIMSSCRFASKARRSK